MVSRHLTTIFEKAGPAWEDEKSFRRRSHDADIKPIRRLCIVGGLRDVAVIRMAQELEVEVCTSATGVEYVNEQGTVLLVEDFESGLFETLYNTTCNYRERPAIIGPAYFAYYFKKGKVPPLPPQDRTRMGMQLKGCVLVLNLKDNGEVKRRCLRRAHALGASVVKEVKPSVTHLISDRCYGRVYETARNLGASVVSLNWLDETWEKYRNDHEFNYADSAFMARHVLPVFCSIKMYLCGFRAEEIARMTQQAQERGGRVVFSMEESTHIIVSSSHKEDEKKHCKKATIVREEWFTSSIEAGYSRNVEPFELKERRGRGIRSTSPMTNSKSSIISKSKSRTSILSGTSDGRKSMDNLLSTSIRPDDEKIFKVVEELRDTEQRYVQALQLLLEMKRGLDTVDPDCGPSWLTRFPNEGISKSDVNMVFGKIHPIVNVHLSILKDLESILQCWRSVADVGNIFVKRQEELQNVYPPFINIYDSAKRKFLEMLKISERFSSFIKGYESDSRWNRCKVEDLLVRPVQRLPSISLLLSEIQKQANSAKASHSETASLKEASKCIERLLNNSNEARRKAEYYEKVIKFYTNIENLPAEYASVNHMVDGEIPVVGVRFLGGSDQWAKSHERRTVKLIFGMGVLLCKVKKTDMHGTMTRMKRRLFRHGSMSDLHSSGMMAEPRLKVLTHFRLEQIREIHAIGKDENQNPNVFVLVVRSLEAHGDVEYMFQVDPMICEPHAVKAWMKRLSHEIMMQVNREEVYKEFDALFDSYPREEVLDTLSRNQVMTVSQSSLASDMTVTSMARSRNASFSKNGFNGASRGGSPVPQVVMRSGWQANESSPLRRLSLPDGNNLLSLPAAVRASISPSQDSFKAAIREQGRLRRTLSNLSLIFRGPFKSTKNNRSRPSSRRSSIVGMSAESTTGDHCDIASVQELED